MLVIVCVIDLSELIRVGAASSCADTGSYSQLRENGLCMVAVPV